MRLLLVSLFFYCFIATANAECLHTDWMNKEVKPCDNFYYFANGNWLKQNKIPDAYSSWSIMRELDDKNEELIHSIVLEAANNAHNKPGSTEQKVGDFYLSGMDEKAIDEQGAKPILPEFARIDNIKNLADLQLVIAHFHGVGINTLFNFGQTQDYKDSTKIIGFAGQGGLGLPDRDYYLSDDPKFVKIRQIYKEHIAKMFQLLGDTEDKSKFEANVVLFIETKLAKASLTRTEERDPHAVYHPMNLLQLKNATPHFNWSQYFANREHHEIVSINLSTPEFFKQMDKLLVSITLTNWKTYLRWDLITASAPFLSKPFVDESFHMGSTLSGAKELLPRWKRVISAENSALGFAMGKLFVEKTFPPSSKVAVKEMINNIRAELKTDLENLSWMSPKTRALALKKLDKMKDRVGYPDHFRDYSALTIDRGPYILNAFRASEFLLKRELNKIGKPLDTNEWDMTPQTVNAYYDPSQNNINMPAGILQPPFFDPKAPAAVNYGAIGVIIGHEMTHGFDDQGAQFSAEGNLKNWWANKDLKNFHQLTDCIANHYSQYVVNGNVHVQGKLVTGEATADLGGATLAYRAFKHSKYYKDAKTIDNFTPDQQFFIAFAQSWALNMREEQARQLIILDPHPPAIDRINGTLANMPEFQQAFHIAAKSDMVNLDRCSIW